jgi:ABC-type antimicrobial peptide transport system permease subunit
MKKPASQLAEKIWNARQNRQAKANWLQPSLILEPCMRELAIRYALGARPRRVLWMIVGGWLRSVLAGVVVGAALTLGASRAVESFLFEVRGFDPLMYGAAIVAMLITATGAAYLPARRANRIDPVGVLRCE